MMLRRTLMALVLAGLCWTVTGCGLAYTAKRNDLLKTASVEDYGPPPPEDYREIEQRMIEGMLKDPESARYQFEEPVRNIIPKGFGSVTPILVWTDEVRVNAKNAFGGYTGFSPWLVAWRDGRIIAITPPTSSGGYGFIWTYLK